MDIKIVEQENQLLLKQDSDIVFIEYEDAPFLASKINEICARRKMKSSKASKAK